MKFVGRVKIELRLRQLELVAVRFDDNAAVVYVNEFPKVVTFSFERKVFVVFVIACGIQNVYANNGRKRRAYDCVRHVVKSDDLCLIFFHLSYCSVSRSYCQYAGDKKCKIT